MFTKIKDLSGILDNHPYYGPLTDKEKLDIINLVIFNNPSFDVHNNVVELITVPDGKIGEDGISITNIIIPELPQGNLEPLGIVTYRELDKAFEKWFDDFNEDTKIAMYNSALTKIQKLQKENYQITNVSNENISTGAVLSNITIGFLRGISIKTNIPEAISNLINNYEKALSQKYVEVLGKLINSFNIKQEIIYNAEALSKLVNSFNIKTTYSVDASGKLVNSFSIKEKIIYDAEILSSISNSFEIAEKHEEVIECIDSLLNGYTRGYFNNDVEINSTLLNGYLEQNLSGYSTTSNEYTVN